MITYYGLVLPELSRFDIEYITSRYYLSSMMRFPELIGQNLNSEKGVFPGDFSSQWTVVLTGFLMEHQATIQTWIPHLRRWEQEYPSLRYYEMPILPAFDFASRVSIHLSMRWYISDRERRERTYPVFTDVGSFLKATNTPGQVRARTFLLDSRGNILINAPGPARPNMVELFERKFGPVQEELWRPGHLQ